MGDGKSRILLTVHMRESGSRIFLTLRESGSCRFLTFALHPPCPKTGKQYSNSTQTAPKVCKRVQFGTNFAGVRLPYCTVSLTRRGAITTGRARRIRPPWQPSLGPAPPRRLHRAVPHQAAREAHIVRSPTIFRFRLTEKRFRGGDKAAGRHAGAHPSPDAAMRLRPWSAGPRPSTSSAGRCPCTPEHPLGPHYPGTDGKIVGFNHF